MNLFEMRSFNGIRLSFLNESENIFLKELRKTYLINYNLIYLEITNKLKEYCDDINSINHEITYDGRDINIIITFLDNLADGLRIKSSTALDLLQNDIKDYIDDKCKIRSSTRYLLPLVEPDIFKQKLTSFYNNYNALFEQSSALIGTNDDMVSSLLTSLLNLAGMFETFYYRYFYAFSKKFEPDIVHNRIGEKILADIVIRELKENTVVEKLDTLINRLPNAPTTLLMNLEIAEALNDTLVQAQIVVSECNLKKLTREQTHGYDNRLEFDLLDPYFFKCTIDECKEQFDFFLVNLEELYYTISEKYKTISNMNETEFIEFVYCTANIIYDAFYIIESMFKWYFGIK